MNSPSRKLQLCVRIALLCTSAITLPAYAQDAIPMLKSSEEQISATTFYPGEEIKPDEIRVTVLGTLGPNYNRHSSSASVLIELGNGDIFLFDIGSGALGNLSSLRIPYSRLTKVFLSHLHVDHVGDLDALWASGAVSLRSEPLGIWGPSGLTEALGTATFVDNFRNLWAWDRESRRGIMAAVASEVEAHEFPYEQVAVVYDANGVRVTAFPAIHGIDGAVSYRLDWNGLSIVYSGDTVANKWMVENARGVDLLIHEVFLTPEILMRRIGMPKPAAEYVGLEVHTHPVEAGKLFSLINPRAVLTFHGSNIMEDTVATVDGIREHFGGPLIIGEDMLVVNVSEESITSRESAVMDMSWPPMEFPGIGMAYDMLTAGEPVEMSAWLAEGRLRFADSPTQSAPTEPRNVARTPVLSDSPVESRPGVLVPALVLVILVLILWGWRRGRSRTQ